MSAARWTGKKTAAKSRLLAEGVPVNKLRALVQFCRIDCTNWEQNHAVLKLKHSVMPESIRK